MGLGGTAKKLQKVMDAAEQLYSKMNEVVTELKQVQSEVEHTSERVDQIERDLARQRALLDALADQQGLDVENVLSEADLSDDSDSAGEQPDETENSTAIYATDEE
jgi:septal ring factor EnvC (AmiA/AmiB activator)